MKKEFNFREELADLEHEQWISWTKYLNANHKIPIRLLKKWEKNWKPYSELDEKTKDSDRIWADKVLKKFNGFIRRVKDLISRENCSCEACRSGLMNDIDKLAGGVTVG